MERESQLKIENCQIRFQTTEIEINALREENQRLRLQCDKQSADLHMCEEKLENMKLDLSCAQESLTDCKLNERR